jgi:hypothetical protein
MTITSPAFELGPAAFDSGSPLARFSCLPASLYGSSRFRFTLTGADRDELLLAFSSLSDSTRIGSFVVSVALGVEGCEGGADEVRDLDRD